MTAICPKIKWYEEAVWHYLSDVFSYKLKASEIGFTNDLIYRILRFYGGRSSNCEVYAFNDNVMEATRGADIDLFIEDKSSGNYHFFMLQAKMMDHNGRYKDIKRWNRYAQFVKLIRSASNQGAFPLYLLFNGNTVNSNTCNKHWGLSIVEAPVIRNLRYSQISMPQAPLVTFNQLYSLNMKPFHVLFCGIPNDYNLPTTIDGNSIYKGYPYINKTISSPDNLSREQESEEKLDKEALDKIKTKNLAKFRIIIRNKKD